MAYKPIKPYVRSPQPIIAGGERKYLEEEQKKLEAVIRDLIAALEEIRAKVP